MEDILIFKLYRGIKAIQSPIATLMGRASNDTNQTE